MKIKLRRYYLYYLGRTAVLLVSALPSSVGLFLFALGGRIAYYILPYYRRVTLENLKIAFRGEKSQRELKAIARGVYENLAKGGFEFIKSSRLNKNNLFKILEVENRQIFDKALAKGKGVIVVTGHIGNWELMAIAILIMGYHGCLIARRIYFHKYEKFLNDMRRFHNIEVIYRDESPRKILKFLKANGALGIVADQDIDSADGVFVDFFGRPAYTPAGPVVLAKASGAPLIPAFMIRKKRKHVLLFREPIEFVDTKNKEEDLRENTRRWSAVVEEHIRQYPDQWVWLHKRWKTKK